MLCLVSNRVADGVDFQDGKYHHARRAGCHRRSRVVARLLADVESVWPKCSTAVGFGSRSQRPAEENGSGWINGDHGSLFSAAVVDLGDYRWSQKQLAALRFFGDLWRVLLCDRHQPIAVGHDHGQTHSSGLSRSSWNGGGVDRLDPGLQSRLAVIGILVAQRIGDRSGKRGWEFYSDFWFHRSHFFGGCLIGVGVC